VIVSTIAGTERVALVERSTDSRGRFTVGSSLSGRRVTVAIEPEDVLPIGRGYLMVRVDHEAILELDVDERGRINLGSSRADEPLEVVVFTGEN
jgi:hypothetical protein